MSTVDFIKQTAASASACGESLIAEWFPNARLVSGELCVGSINGEPGESLKINLRKGNGFWKDHSSSAPGGMDLVSLRAAQLGVDQLSAAKEISERLNLPMHRESIARAASKHRTSFDDWQPLEYGPDVAAPTFKQSKEADGWKKHPISASWDYRTADGYLAGQVCRVDYGGGKKDTFPRTYCQAGERKDWRWKAMREPRPLYRLPELIASDLHVLIVEGEKCADAAHRMIGDIFSVTTWAGGCSAVNKSNWSHLAGRQVTIWPDNDEPGMKAARQIRDILAGIAVVSIITPEPLWGDGFDIADAERDGWSVEDIEGVLYSAHQDGSVPIEQSQPEADAPFFEPEGFNEPQYITAEPAVIPQRLPRIAFKGEGVRITDSAIELFSAFAKAKTLFRRSNKLWTTFSGTLVPFVSSNLKTFSETVCEPCSIVKLRDDLVMKPQAMTAESADSIMNCNEAISLLPQISTVNACPLLIADGKRCLVLSRGYHPHKGGILITGGDKHPSVSIAEAVSSLSAILDGFDFITPSDRSRAIASFLSPAVRMGGFLSDSCLFPADFAQADSSRAGKTKRQHLTAAIYGEVMDTITKREGGVGSGLDEAISSALIRGKPFVLIDNLRGNIDSQALEAVTACYGTYHARALRTEAIVDPRMFNWYMTTNGAQVTEDLKNRLSIISIRKRPENYQFKKFQEGDIVDHVRKNQSYYLACVHSVITEWNGLGRPTTNESRHNFQEWARAMDWIVQNLFDAAPLMDGHEQAAQLTTDSRRIFVRKLALRLVNREHGPTPFMCASELAEFVADEADADLEIPGARGSRDSHAIIIGRLLGKILGKKPSIVGDEYPFDLGGVSVIRRAIWSHDRNILISYGFVRS